MLLVAAVCVRLGFWQLSRLEERRVQNSEIAGALASPIRTLDANGLQDLLSDPSALLNRRVTISGTFISDAAVILRGRAREGRPGVHLITPLQIEGTDAAILVNRGWLPSPDAASVDPRPHAISGQTQVTGIILPIEAEDEDPMPAVLEVDGQSVSTYQRIDLALLEERAGEPLLPAVLQQLNDDRPSEPPHPVALPSLDEGPHFSYAIQWFSFAVIALVGYAVMVLRRRPQKSIS